MNKLVIRKGKNTPYILMDNEAHVIKVEGISIPNDADVFYKEFLSWFDEYVSKDYKEHLTIDIRLDYVNTASNLALILFFKKVNDYNCSKVVNWIYDEDDEDVLDWGVKMSNLTKLKINLVPIG